MAFAVFGIGAFLIAWVGFPLLRVLGGSRDRRERRAQYLVHLSFRLFAAFMKVLRLIRVSVIGRERLRGSPAAVVIANHPTLIDVVLLIAAMPQADCVVKQGAWQNLFLRGVVAGAGYLRNTDGPELVEACVERLRAGRWLLLFPEGTRSPREGLGTFRRGVAHIALRAGADIVPVVITCDPPTLMKGQPWYGVPDRTVQLTLTVGEQLRPRAPETVESSGRTVREWTADIRYFYEARLGHGNS